MQVKRTVIESRRGLQQEIADRFHDQPMYYYVTVEPIFDAQGKVIGLTGATLDISQQRRLEARHADFTLQMEVQRRLLEQREMERLNIARDLHDGPLQELTAVSFGIHEAMAEDQKEARIARLQAVQQQLSKQLHELRVFCNDLRPPTLAPFGLERAIRSHADTFEERHPDIFVHLDLAPDRQLLPEGVRMAFFRIYQEAMNNIVKHSKAKNVWITLTVDAQEIALEIVDDGDGFSVPEDWIKQARDGHLGLIGMRERATAMNARLDFDSKPGYGAVIRITTSDFHA
jgi:signal transduction histidine kinase